MRQVSPDASVTKSLAGVAVDVQDLFPHQSRVQ